MMVTRSTQLTLAGTANRSLQTAMTELARLQDQASSQRAITRPSDDPRATAEALSVRSEQRAVAQFQRNADNAQGWLTTVDRALGSATSVLQRARDLAVQGANDGALSPAAREGLAAEFEGLRDDLLTQANTAYLGRSVFAGDSAAGLAVDAAYDFTGTGTAPVTRRVDEGRSVRVDADGASIFGQGAASTFALLDAIAADLRAGIPIRDRIDEVDARLTGVVTAHAEIGSRQTQLDRTVATLASREVAIETQRSAVEDVDLAKVILDLTVQSTVYQSALAVTARVLPPTLMEFLR